MTLNTQETATVLAALRYWQHNVIRHQIEPTDIPYEYHDHFADDRPLDRREIDALCERINLGEERHNYLDQALDELLTYMDGYERDWNHDEPLPAFEKARTALAKARGEEGAG